MDNDLCIIFEKGIKPVKANKYYYFTHQKMYRDLQANKLDHNNFDAGVRGEWRKYNPYNPYVPEAEKKAAENLKVESLDDLFETDEIEMKAPEMPNETIEEPIMQEELKEVEQEKPQKEPVIDFLDFDDFEAPTLPQEEGEIEKERKERAPIFTQDLQKELEAKFDELFGPME